ncbi:alanine--glyoxylate aminotransferase family protein [Coriobacteriia bacterium Es71-Z0120]|uniref:pyridoxal-phosphate-dependent aminotransferase family protein n=1 Tax=Parvivirga hydrogeniphila TaxID=2939460 RepID=UPI0022608A11|nr:alanine--glyoxylate aminotransferase family protein [Parvivirga hydrogeniphila]MCL4078701.1 alanine--glyoxylate aminotransferase family protein [Parvivirga hydrogeniphila]
MQKKYLMTPGPTPVPAEVLLTQAAPMIHHRTPDFSAAFMEAIDGLKYVFQTEASDVLIFASSGTGAMESSIANCFCAGDSVIVCRNGKFGDRMKQIAEVYGLNVIDLNYEWTQVVDPADVATALEENPGVRGVIVTQSETSSGVLNDVERIGAIVREYPDVVLIVDSITGIGAVECKTDEWGLDVVMTGSQKGLMLPPGLAAITVSEKAWRAYERSTLPKFYFDWKKYKKNLEKQTTPFTPAVSLVLGLNEALKMIRAEGIENVIARHARLAEATRKGCEALGLQLFAPPEGRGNAVTPVWVPDGVDGKAIVKIMKDKYGVTIAGGQDEYAGRIFRVGHLGYFGEFDIITTLAALEMTLAELGYEFERGAGIKAAEAVFMGA